MTTRTTSPAILPAIAQRWSPRAFDGSAVPQADLELIFEAAGLAPSAYNYQPWTFLYAIKGDANWDAFLSLLIPFNASWAKEAGALVFIVSEKDMVQGEKVNPNHSHSFDAGAAWGYAALQAKALGYDTHGMTGLDMGKATAELAIPDTHRLEAAFVIGKAGDKAILPDFLQGREAPGTRKPVTEILRAGRFA
ncbi:nitroreductase [Novosphingobium sp. FSY-8]|uniref:Nitroreductase n=1 Tax=Novosphingobium ovatum TaxID=1908523 RepID=A0ABW9XH62_9SPHN|nr:nitroreductase family protein [Novosphingobium ovatum]NBC37888.1 nitroreductase [Novosphingobium ovatum]